MECVPFRSYLSIYGVSSVHDQRFPNFCFDKIPIVASRKKLSVSMCIGDSSMKTPGFEANATLKSTEDQSEELRDESLKSYSSVESTNGKPETEVLLAEDKDLSAKRYAKIHDFCLGIPFGGIVAGGGLIGFILSRNVASLTTGGLLGGAILAMGVISLKVWRQGLSSLPFMLGQAALAATLLWKHLHAYSLTKKILPSGFYIAMSAAMLCFYSYVLVSGGNPPPKKKAAVSSTS